MLTFPSGLTSALVLHLPPLSPTHEGGVVFIFDVVGQIAGDIHLRLAKSIAQPGKAIAAVLDIPIIPSSLLECFYIVESAPWP